MSPSSAYSPDTQPAASPRHPHPLPIPPSTSKYLHVTLAKAPDELSAVRDVFPVARIVSGDGVTAEEAIVRTKAALLTLRSAWGGKGAAKEWSELDECFAMFGFAPDPSKSIVDPAAALDVLHGHFRRMASQAIRSHEGLDSIVSCIETVTTFSLSEAHREMGDRYKEAFDTQRRRLGGKAERRMEGEVARLAILGEEVGLYGIPSRGRSGSLSSPSLPFGLSPISRPKSKPSQITESVSYYEDQLPSSSVSETPNHRHRTSASTPATSHGYSTGERKYRTKNHFFLSRDEEEESDDLATPPQAQAKGYVRTGGITLPPPTSARHAKASPPSVVIRRRESSPAIGKQSTSMTPSMSRKGFTSLEEAVQVIRRGGASTESLSGANIVSAHLQSERETAEDVEYKRGRKVLSIAATFGGSKRTSNVGTPPRRAASSDSISSSEGRRNHARNRSVPAPISPRENAPDTPSFRDTLGKFKALMDGDGRSSPKSLKRPGSGGKIDAGKRLSSAGKEALKRPASAETRNEERRPSTEGVSVADLREMWATGFATSTPGSTAAKKWPDVITGKYKDSSSAKSPASITASSAHQTANPPPSPYTPKSTVSSRRTAFENEEREYESISKQKSRRRERSEETESEAMEREDSESEIDYKRESRGSVGKKKAVSPARGSRRKSSSSLHTPSTPAPSATPAPTPQATVPPQPQDAASTSLAAAAAALASAATMSATAGHTTESPGAAAQTLLWAQILSQQSQEMRQRQMQEQQMRLMDAQLREREAASQQRLKEEEERKRQKEEEERNRLLQLQYQTAASQLIMTPYGYLPIHQYNNLSSSSLAPMNLNVGMGNSVPISGYPTPTATVPPPLPQPQAPAINTPMSPVDRRLLKKPLPSPPSRRPDPDMLSLLSEVSGTEEDGASSDLTESSENREGRTGREKREALRGRAERAALVREHRKKKSGGKDKEKALEDVPLGLLKLRSRSAGSVRSAKDVLVTAGRSSSRVRAKSVTTIERVFSKIDKPLPPSPKVNPGVLATAKASVNESAGNSLPTMVSSPQPMALTLDRDHADEEQMPNFKPPVFPSNPYARDPVQKTTSTSPQGGTAQTAAEFSPGTLGPQYDGVVYRRRLSQGSPMTRREYGRGRDDDVIRVRSPGPWDPANEVDIGEQGAAGYLHGRHPYDSQASEPPPRFASLAQYRQGHVQGPTPISPSSQHPTGTSTSSVARRAGGSVAATTATYLMEEEEVGTRGRAFVETVKKRMGYCEGGTVEPFADAPLDFVDTPGTPPSSDDGIAVGMDAISYVDAKRKKEAEMELAGIARAAKDVATPGRRSVSQPPALSDGAGRGWTYQRPPLPTPPSENAPSTLQRSVRFETVENEVKPRPNSIGGVSPGANGGGRGSLKGPNPNMPGGSPDKLSPGGYHSSSPIGGSPKASGSLFGLRVGWLGRQF
ncbi:hypothetical protein HDU97_003158 [Phlyctochytrium planicorne]|nr:hypothetical protein HDU97_003158 [Phlyctochytrium planicorne]